MNTLLLDTVTWDLTLDASGNIAVASDPYSVAQDVASACRLFKGEWWYDTAIGVPYFQQILGQAPPAGMVKSRIAEAALRVPGCSSPVVFLSDLGRDRVLTGQVQFTDSNGTTQAVAF